MTPTCPIWRRRRGSRLASTVALTTLGVGALLPAPAGAADDPALAQTVEADEATAHDPVVIDTGHVDLGPRFIDGAWRLQARDDRQVPPVWRFLDEVVLHLTDAAILAAPDGPDYAFLDVDPGAPLWVIPQTQEHDVVWLGWNTQDPEVAGRIGLGASLTLHGVDGPGSVFLFLQEGVAGPPNLLWDSTVDRSQELWMEVNTHVHANWVFTEPGVYRLHVEVHADLDDDTRGSDTAVLRFAVGDDTDGEALLAAAESRPGPDDPDAGPSPPGTADPTDPSPSATAFPIVLVAVAAGTTVLVGAIALVTRSGRRTRAAAEAARRSDTLERPS